MGSCSSVQRSTSTNTDMKLKLAFGSKTEKLVNIPPSPIKEQQPKNGNFKWSPSRSTTQFTDKGSKEEAFFDSKAWLDSDCEDDFYSVNGDFTPSRGSTPVHHTFGTPGGVNKTPYQNRTPGSLSQPSPEKKKKLLDLFRESIRDDQDGDGNGKKEVVNSASSSERTMSEDRVSIRVKSARSLQWCIPSLSSCRSFRERRRKKSSPAIAVNGKY